MDAVSELPLWLVLIGSFLLLATVVTFFVNAGPRARIDGALKSAPSRKPFGPFALSHGDVRAKLEQQDLVAPEELWTYDADYVERFAKAASRAALPQTTALALYVGPVLHWDIAFAVALGLFVAIVDLASAALVDEPLLSGVLIFCGAMGVVYGAADVAEDLKLISILTDWHAQVRTRANTTIESARIDGGEAAAANALTRIKMITITLSIVGIVIFMVMKAVAAVVYRTPGNPTPAPSGDGRPAIAPG